MKIGYNKIWGILCLMFDGLICCLTAAFVRMEEQVSYPAALTAGFWLFLLFGILLLTQPYVRVNPDGVVVKSLMGLRTESYPIRSARDLSVDDQDVYVTSNLERQRLPVSMWLVDRGGWNSFIKWIETAKQKMS